MKSTKPVKSSEQMLKNTMTKKCCMVTYTDFLEKKIEEALPILR